MARSSLFELYRLRAAECNDFAQRVTDKVSRQMLLRMAQGWLTLAEQTIKNSETTLVYETPEPRQHVAQQQQQPDDDNKE